MKYAWIENHRDEYTVSRMCRVLSVSRSGYCQWRVRSPSARERSNQALDARVAVLHRESRRSYGRPRITQQLRQQGECVGGERVRRSLNRQGLRPVYRRAYVVTTDSNHHLPVAPNVLERRFDCWQPNQAWVGDITYVWTGEGWLYLAAVMDLASRRIVGWSMSEPLMPSWCAPLSGPRVGNANPRRDYLFIRTVGVNMQVMNTASWQLSSASRCP